MRVRAVSLTGAFVLAAAGLIAAPSGVAQAVPVPCSGGFDADGDGVQDVVFGMPNEDVGSPVQKDAGVVTLEYGNSTTHTFSSRSLLITEEMVGGGKSEAGDKFGAAVAVGDLNGDNCKDLIIGSPGENSRNGRIVIVYSKSDGSGLDLTSYQTINQDTLPGSPVAEVGDDFGASLAIQGVAGSISLWVGSPGENIGTVKGAGEVFRFTGGTGGAGTKMSLTSGITGYYEGGGAPGSYEDGDRFGEVMSGTANSVLFGVPKEDIGSGTSRHVDAGQVLIYTNAWSSFTQDTTVPNVPGASERGDLFGASVTQIPSCTGNPNDEGYVVGSPGEGVGTQAKAGYVTVVDLPSGGTASLIQGDGAGLNYVGGSLEAGDAFGFKVAASGNLLAVGSPLEDTGTTKSGTNAGTVYQGRMGCAGSVPNVGLHSTLSMTQSGSNSEKGDRFGLELGFNRVDSADARLVVGAPLKADGSVNDSGRAIVYTTLSGAGGLFVGTPSTNLGQSLSTVAGSQEIGDQFGNVISSNP